MLFLVLHNKLLTRLLSDGSSTLLAVSYVEALYLGNTSPDTSVHACPTGLSPAHLGSKFCSDVFAFNHIISRKNEPKVTSITHMFVKRFRCDKRLTISMDSMFVTE